MNFEGLGFSFSKFLRFVEDTKITDTREKPILGFP